MQPWRKYKSTQTPKLAMSAALSSAGETTRKNSADLCSSWAVNPCSIALEDRLCLRVESLATRGLTPHGHEPRNAQLLLGSLDRLRPGLDVVVPLPSISGGLPADDLSVLVLGE